MFLLSSTTVKLKNRNLEVMEVILHQKNKYNVLVVFMWDTDKIRDRFGGIGRCNVKTCMHTIINVNVST